MRTAVRLESVIFQTHLCVFICFVLHCLFYAFPQLWMRLSGALQKKRTSEISYREIVKNSSNDDTTAAKQVHVISATDLL